MYALIETHKGMDWYFGGAGWSSSPVAYFSTRLAAERSQWRNQAEARRHNTGRRYRVESDLEMDARLAG